MTSTARQISVHHDGEGYVARCTESDSNGPIMGRVAMDEPLAATTIDEARNEAARHFGIRVEDVK